MDLQSILKTGKQINLSLTNAQGEKLTLKTLIESPYKNNQFSIASPMHEGNFYPLHPKDCFSVIFETSSFDETESLCVYAMAVQVLERNKQGNQIFITLSKQDSPQKIQRRETFRLRMVKTLNYFYQEKSADLLLKDISISGLRGIVTRRLPIKSTIEVLLDLEDKKRPIKLKAEVLSCDLLSDSIIQHDLRLKFLDTTPMQNDALSHYIFKKQSESLQKMQELNDNSNLYETLYGHKNNKRRKNDFLVKSVPVLGLISWIMSLFALAFFLQARPEMEYNLDQFFNFYKRSHWDLSSLQLSFFTASAELFLCALGLFMNSKRLKRKEDQYHKGLIFNVFFSLAIIISYFFMMAQSPS